MSQPTVDDYHPLSEALFDDPFPLYRVLRDESPVHYLEEFDTWFLSRFEDIWKAEQDLKSFSAQDGVTLMELLGTTGDVPLELEGTNLSGIAGLDPPEHTRARAVIGPAFRPAAVARLEPITRGFVREHLDALTERDEFDLLNDLAMKVSVRVACTIAGLPLSDADGLADCVNGFFDREPGEAGTTETGREAFTQMTTYLVGFLDDLQKSGRQTGGVADALVAFAGETDMPLLELTGHLALLLVGGTETLPKVATAAAYRLWQHPEQRAALVADPSLGRIAFEEALRYDMPTNMLGRTVVRDTEIRGRQLRTGQKIMFLWPSGNRDEREFPDPGRFDIRRDPKRILSFGHGTHVCLGAHVARMEGRLIVEELLARAPEYEVIEERAVRLRSEFFRGFRSLPVRLRP